MSCCGQKRSELQVSPATSPAQNPERPAITSHVVTTPAFVLFEYVGPTGLTVRGPITRATYRFDNPGARVEVDVRDAPSFLAVPNLRRAKSQTKVNEEMR
jgi:hypothetical protein